MSPTPLTTSKHRARVKVLLARVRQFDELPSEVTELLAATALPHHFEAG